MYLLSFYQDSSSNLSWNIVSDYLQNRTSTQVRTHIQKFKWKLITNIKLIKNLIAKLETSKQVPELSKADASLVNSLTLEYLYIYEDSLKNGLKGNKTMDSFTNILLKNNTIPRIIIENYNCIASRNCLEVALTQWRSDLPKLIELLQQLGNTLEQELSCCTMNPDRLKSEFEKNILSEDT